MALKLLFLFFCLGGTLFADRIDSTASSFEIREKKRVDNFDFSGDYPKLENIDIDAKKKMRVELHLTGLYPVLKKINYEGGFGTLSGKLTGSFPELETIDITCGNTAMALDFSGKWEKDCEIHIRGTDGDITLALPKDVGIIVKTKTAPLGKVINHSLEKKGFGLFNKIFLNSHYKTCPITLTFSIEARKGKIVLN